MNNKGSVRSSDWAGRPTSENLLFQEHCAANEFDLHRTGDQTERHCQPPPHTPSSGLGRARCTAPPLCQQVVSLLFGGGAYELSQKRESLDGGMLIDLLLPCEGPQVCGGAGLFVYEEKLEESDSDSLRR